MSVSNLHFPHLLWHRGVGWTGSTHWSAYSRSEAYALDAQVQAHPEGASSPTLMRRAARACWALLDSRYRQETHVTVFCGPGNNGGDGLALAAIAAHHGKTVTLVDALALSTDGRQCLAEQPQPHLRTLWEIALAAGCQTAADGRPPTVGVLVDAITGIGINRAIAAPVWAQWDRCADEAVVVFSVDMPSGLCPSTGYPYGGGRAVKADLTLTMLCIKRGLLTGDAHSYTGDLYLSQLGAETALADGAGQRKRHTLLYADSMEVASLLPPSTAHKGARGHLLVVGGDQSMPGAVGMCIESAVRIGIGRVSASVHLRSEANVTALAPETMLTTLPPPSHHQYQAMVLGPGLGRSPWSRQQLRDALAYAHQATIPCVLDADALRLLPELAPAMPATRVLTPHAAEAATLLGCTVADIAADRFAAAEGIARQYDAVCVLKGAGTLIAGGDEPVASICPSGNAVLAMGGTGDVLAGMIGTLLAKGFPARRACEVAVCVHAQAADHLACIASPVGMRIAELHSCMAEIFRATRATKDPH